MYIDHLNHDPHYQLPTVRIWAILHRMDRQPGTRLERVLISFCFRPQSTCNLVCVCWMYACYKINTFKPTRGHSIGFRMHIFWNRNTVCILYFFWKSEAVTWRDDGAAHLDPTESRQCNCHWTRRMDYGMTGTCNFKFTYKYTLQECQ